MTINESAAPGNGRGSQSSPRPAPNGSKPQAPSRAPLIDRLLAGEPYAIAFGGQGSSWLDALEEITRDSGIEPEITDLVNEATRLVAPVADELLVVRPLGFDPIGWMLERDLAEEGEGNPGPSDTVLTSAPVSPPGIFLCQLAALRALTLQGIDPAVTRPVVSVGHSQGLLGVYSVGDDAARDAELLAIAQLSGAAAALVGRRRGLIGSSPRSPMMSVANVDPDELRAVVAEVAHGVDPKIAPFVSIRNGRRRVVVSGAPAQLERLRDRCKEITAEQTKERDAKKRGGAVFAPVFEPIAVGLAFHHPTIEECVDIAGDWAAKCGIDVERTREIASRCLFEPVDWVVETDRIIESGARWVLDLGPGDLLTRMTSAALRGTDIGVIPVATRGGQRNLLTPGATPEVRTAWSTFAPKPVTLPDGRVVVETAFTKLTGRSPILLAGMTPTTVDAKIVAAAANAGHWAELAGGGQVTEPIFLDRVAELRTLLEPGRAVQFNSLFLDPYLWKLQLGGRRLVQRSRAAGAPFDGVVVTAGIPELEEAVALIEELTEAGIAHIAFKPGTVAQIRSVVRIANEVPNVPVIMHIEGGRAGGHHSWEDLDDLLIETYAELRTRPNLVVCVGGGIGTPERAADYLTGRWSTAHGYPEMPLDGILVGTAAMAALEATTSPQVKQLLVDTPGTPDWVGAGTAEGGMASGRSQLGADIHEIDNAASRTGRLLDEVAGDAEAVAKRRDEIIAALDVTAKPYFGDIATMTYGQWLQRYVELAVGLDPHQDFDCGSDLGDVLNAATESPWLDRTWRDRFADMLQRAEARLHPVDRGPIPTLFSDPETLERPVAALCALKARYPETDTAILHPADVSFFVSLCKTPGKPVNFVPVVDGDVRRWWRSDSLWQAHDPRYTADQVCVIPGTVAVAGITRVDEPVGDLLNRFEKATTDALLAAGVAPTKVASRRDAGVAVGPVDIVLAAPDVTWSSRLTRNPVGRLGEVSEWTVNAAGSGATHQRTGASLVEIDSQNVQLEVPLNNSGASVKIRIAVPSSTHDGGAPVVSDADAESSMSALLAVAAAGELPEVKVTAGKPVAHLNLAWSPDLVADHGGVTSSGLPEQLDTVGTTVPDVVVGACWPAVFAVLGATRTAEGTSVIEGMLDLVHLDHQVNFVRELPSDTSIFAVRAESTSVLDTDLGRVVEVQVEIGVMRDHGLATPTVATLVERFAIRGRSGTGELTDPPRAGGALGTDAADTPRKRRRDTTIEAPRNMAAFAKVSGDHNPIHTSGAAALLAGLGSPIVHGMWLSAAAQQVVSAADAAAGVPARRLTAWTTRFLGMVRPGAKIDVRVDRIAIDAGAEVVEVSCRVEGDLVMVATGRLAVPKTIYAFPGQGIQRPGMGLDARTRSKAAKAIWDRADKHTRKALGFSILAVVRDNPTYIKARGVEHRHPAGVLHLTQFTQVAMATLGVAQIAELRESGAFVEGALLAGHSVGEYNALAAAAGVLPLEAVLEVVFQRGSAMHALVPRDDKGNSNYRMAAIRPSQIGLADADVQSFIAEIASRTGEFLEVVNLNLRGSQYAIAGTVEGLAELETEIDERRAQTGGKRAFILVPGIDVPFHSTVLRDGVPEFRHKLEALLPADLHPEILVGRYIPNLVPKPFSLERDFVQEIADLVPSEPLDEVLADFDDWAARPADLCRVVLIELLAWQFASPVRWIETQDLLFTDEAHGGLGVERFIEVGLASAPTVAGLATNTLKLPGRIGGPVEVLNIERDAAVVYATDVDAAPAEEDDAPVAAAPEAAATAAKAAPVAAPAAPSGGPRPDDIVFSAADATKVLIALWTKLRLDQIGPVDTIEALCDGVSSRRNQLLVDLGSELSLGAIDGAADADMAALAGTVEKLARTYKPFGSVLSDSIGDHLRKVFGPSGRRPAAITDRVKKVWELGDGWANHVMAEVSLGTRDGASVRGGSLGGLADGALADAAAVDKVIDAAVAAVASRRGISVALPSTGGGGGGTVDAAALGEFTENITGRNGVLASAARLVLEQLGLTDEVTVAALSTETDLVDLVSAELGSDWPRLVAPSFDGKRAVLLDDRWATAREDLARLWIGDDSISSITADTFVGAGKAVAAQALWWQQRATAADKAVLAAAYGQIADAAVRTEIGEYSSDVAVVTGGSKGSIAAAVAGKLLGGGATVVVTTSRLDDERLGFYRELYRNNARAGAALWVVPANMASYADVDALIDWVGSEQVDTAGGAKKVTKAAMTPTLLFPFAAPRVAGDLADAGARAEMEMRVLLWSVERLIGGLGKIGYDHDVDSRLHVVLPGSPNRGLFGGDGAYGESKAALDAVVARWSAERSWAERVTIAHALIGWVRGTGLMGHNDPLVDAVEEAGVRTWSTLDMANALLELCTPEARLAAADKPNQVDLTGGLAEANLDLPALAKRAAEAPSVTLTEADEEILATISALAAPPSVATVLAPPAWSEVTADPADLVLIVGVGEVGPYGSARTRFEMEVDEELSAAGVLELAWTTGLVTWENDPKPGWYDAESGDLVAEADIADKYHDAVVARCGIRRYEDDGSMVDNHAPLLTSVFLDDDLKFIVTNETEARSYYSADPEHTVIAPVADSTDWQVTRRAGTEIRVPRKMRLTRSVGGQIPTGFDPTKWGISADMASSIDRVALWNIVSTVDAFISSGFTPSELMRWVHPSLVANTQGSGMGGMTSIRSMYVDTMLGEPHANDILQEALGNVVAAHVVQSYVGSYGAMVHPVAACATAAVSVEEGVDKIKLGKADFVVAGGFDDLSTEAIIGFADMSATADADVMHARGISDRRFSRANDRRRGGFVESNGGGTVLLARGDVALEMGLPVLGVVAFAQSFGDGVHTSIPAPGLGALGAGRGGRESKLAAALNALGVTADDIAVISKHDTSTNANDPNEAELHERLAAAIGRSEGAPLFVVSQKSLTGHAKGGAAAFQINGLCQVLSQGVVPPNRSLDCVDDKMAEFGHLVWAREPLRFGESYGLKAGLVTSLGFGHVSGLVAIVHPEAFVQSIAPERRAEYVLRAGERAAAGRQKLAQSMCGGDNLYQRPADRRLGGDDVAAGKIRQLEADMLLSETARLGNDGVYNAGTGCA